MKLTLLTRRYPPLIGGAEKVLSYLAPALAEEGHAVTVLTSRLDPTLPEREDVPTSRGSCRVLRLPTSPSRFIGTWRYMRALRRALEHDPPDVAYVSMLKHDAYAAVGVARRLGFPVVLRPEGAGATGDIAWQGWGRGGRAIGRRCRQADAIVAISEAVAAELRGAGYDPSKIIELPNGVPIPRQPWSRPEKNKEESRGPRAVFVGRLAVEKDLPTLLNAWAIVRETYPHSRLTLVGDGPERPALERLATTPKLAEAVVFTGATPDPEPFLRGSDLFVLPSREEGMSIALLEAMALGMPVAVSSIPGNRKLITDFEHGRLFPPGDANELARTILEVWSELDRAMGFGHAARIRVEREYSITTMARRHLELFEQLRRARGRR